MTIGLGEGHNKLNGRRNEVLRSTKRVYGFMIILPRYLFLLISPKHIYLSIHNSASHVSKVIIIIVMVCSPS